MLNQVNPIYMQNAELFHHKARITKISFSEINKKMFRWVQLNETIFHPKGGGQLSDAGSIAGMPVLYVHKEVPDKSHLDQFEILHCFAEDALLPFQVGDEVELIIDGAVRQLHSKLHTAGHLLASTTQAIYPALIPFHGNHDPKDGYVKFRIIEDIPINEEEIKTRIQPLLIKKIQEDLPVVITQDNSGLRAIQIEDSVMTCGGTHVAQLSSIGNVDIKGMSHNKKENILTIKYGI